MRKAPQDIQQETMEAPRASMRSGNGHGRPSRLDDARLEETIAKIKLLDLEYARRSGELIEREGAEKRIFELARAFRDAMLAWPSRVAPRIASALDCTVLEAYTLLDGLIKEQLVDLAKIDVSLRQSAPDVGPGAGAGVANASVGLGRQSPNTNITRQRRTRPVEDK